MERIRRFVRTNVGTVFGCTVLFVFGLIFGLLVHNTPAPSSFTLALQQDDRYPFVQPLVGITTTKDYGAKTLAGLHDTVARTASASAGITRYAYYFRDLTNGMWTGINETDQYDPASMLKLVVAVSVFKQEELTPEFIYRRLTYTPELAAVNSAFPFAPKVALQVGQSYSVQYLLQEMLSDSDNGAKDLLLSSLDQAVVDHVYTDLNIRKPNDNNSAGYTISPQEYSRFLRVLYYGLYNLSWENSNAVLALLNDSTFTSGLVAGVPSDVHVAHKFGEHVIGSGSTVNGVELSDCGIVYHPKTPYLICVMTEGKDPLELADFIARLSKATYQEVDAKYKS